MRLWQDSLSQRHSINCARNTMMVPCRCYVADGGGVGCGDGRPINRFEECRCHFWRIHMIKFKAIVPRVGEGESDEKRGMRHFSVVSPSVRQSRTFATHFLPYIFIILANGCEGWIHVRNDSDRNLVPTINFVIVFFSCVAERVALCALHTRHTQRERETHSDWQNLCMLNTFPCIAAAAAEAECTGVCALRKCVSVCTTPNTSIKWHFAFIYLFIIRNDVVCILCQSI